MKEFFGIGGFTREPNGAFSWQHITQVSFFVLLMVGLAIGIGIWMRKKEYKTKNRVIIISAISILSFEAVKIIVNCIHSDNLVKTLLWNLPLFLCSIQLIAIPVAAFCRGRLKEGALDFVMMFGILGALVGPIGAIQDYNAYPAFCFHNIVSAITHSISGFTSLYIIISGMASVKKKNAWISHAILGVFGVLAYIVNVICGLSYGGNIFDDSPNYMFLMADDGTPYTIVTAMVGGNKVLYPIVVMLLFVLYMAIFYGIYFLVRHLRAKKKALLDE
ncbi:MAG: YwaF family protein [Clostridia bacterium]|nr:YwaF family protein [Clostridia bacterium]